MNKFALLCRLWGWSGSGDICPYKDNSSLPLYYPAYFVELDQPASANNLVAAAEFKPNMTGPCSNVGPSAAGPNSGCHAVLEAAVSGPPHPVKWWLNSFLCCAVAICCEVSGHHCKHSQSSLCCLWNQSASIGLTRFCLALPSAMLLCCTACQSVHLTPQVESCLTLYFCTILSTRNCST